MLENFPFYLTLVLVIVMLIMLANKIKVAYPVLLVVAGLLISFIPNIPKIEIEPNVIFLIFLPPLLYEAAWTVSWKEMWRWRRIITSFAFVVVFLTAMSVAFVANHFIPGFSMALGFLLGGIVSPPDAVSAGAILKFVKVPKVISSILEGESLLNDASSLIIFRFALIAVATGQFIWLDASMSFVWMVIGGVGIGLSIGWVFMKAHKFLPTDANMDIIITIVTPYVMYLAAEEVHSSGVLAVVSGGLYLSNKRHHFLSSTSRLKSVTVWESFCFILNGIVFMLIGLMLPEITAGLEGVSMYLAVQYGVVITFVLIVFRIITAYGAVITTLIMRNFIKVADGNPGMKGPFVLGWTGMRGVVSLAAALSIPEYLSDGTPFPQRNLILFITFIVILLTLLIQGLTLPYVINLLIPPNSEEELTEDQIFNQLKKQLADHALLHLNTNYTEQMTTQPALQQMAKKWAQNSSITENDLLIEECKVVYLDILDQQRQWLRTKNWEEASLDEDIVRKHFRLLDLEEERLAFL